NHADLVSLIEDGVGTTGGSWADLGAGEGAFTRALSDLLGSEARIVAVDKDASALRALDSRFETRVGDFTKPLDLHDLDGVVMANSLHYVRDKDPVLRLVHGMLRPGGDRKSTRLNSSHVSISYAVFCLKKKKENSIRHVPPL